MIYIFFLFPLFIAALIAEQRVKEFDKRADELVKNINKYLKEKECHTK